MKNFIWVIQMVKGKNLCFNLLLSNEYLLEKKEGKYIHVYSGLEYSTLKGAGSIMNKVYSLLVAGV